MKRFLIFYFLLIIFCAWLSSCKTHKQKESFSSQFETINTADTTVKKYERINADYLRINESLIRRDGMLTIRFDSLTSVLVMPDRSIRAIGYNPVIESHTKEEEKLSSKDSLNYSRSDSLQSTGSKKKEESGSVESSSTEVLRKPSLIPWIGAGLAVVMITLAILWYFFKRIKR